MLSKAAGAAYGVAKYPYVIIVRRATKLFIEDAIDRITWVIQDWLSERDSANVKVATINISWAFESTKIKDEEKLKLPQFQSLFVRAIQEGILPICAAGNHPGVMWPQGPKPIYLCQADADFRIYRMSLAILPNFPALMTGKVCHDNRQLPG